MARKLKILFSALSVVVILVIAIAGAVLAAGPNSRGDVTQDHVRNQDGTCTGDATQDRLRIHDQDCTGDQTQDQIRAQDRTFSGDLLRKRLQLKDRTC
jgi:hypothetical protein